MKVLFAVSSEEISDRIIKKYQKDYKEILAYKNVYYFNAILKEIQRDKTYDRIIISEDLEPFANNNYDTIDKFVFEKLDSISDEAHDMNGNEIPLILICTERRSKGSNFLVKLFGLGIYNALLGTDRSMEQVCKLISRPRGKKEAKMYYKIDSEDVNYKAESENEVSELEIQNILSHFKKLGKSTERYTQSFDNIAAQYTDEQLKIIINCLPIKVKAVLEEQSKKYQEIMTANGFRSVGGQTQSDGVIRTAGLSINMIGDQTQKINGPIVIPNAVRTSTYSKQINISQTARPAGQPLAQAAQGQPAAAQPVQPAQSAQPAQAPNGQQYTPEQLKIIEQRRAALLARREQLLKQYTPEQLKILAQRQAALKAQQAKQAAQGAIPNVQGGEPANGNGTNAGQTVAQAPQEGTTNQ